jgi:hypothetical protein
MRRWPTFAALAVTAFASGAMGCRAYAIVTKDLSVDWPKTFASIHDAAQTIAFAVAACWTYLLFVRQRLHAERADLSHDVAAFNVSQASRLIRVVVTIKNVGSVAIKPPQLSVIVSRLLPIDESSLQDQLHLALQSSPPTTIAKWPQVRTRDVDLRNDQVVLEPGETEKFPFDFLIPSVISVIQVHSQLKCGEPAGEYWDETTTHELSGRHSLDKVGQGLPKSSVR